MNVVGEWSRVLARTLVEAGVRDVIVSPGSRSTPYVLAVDAEPGLDVHVIVDERAAAFHALGRARVSGRAAALLCTSGTAAANYLPAVVEADAAHVPLVVITADRPLSLMACGANQTIEQLGLFRGRTRFTVDLGVPRADEPSMRAMRRSVCRAVAEAMGEAPGPVHLDARAEKPLEPGPAVDEDDALAEASAARVLERPLTRASTSRRLPSDADLRDVVERIDRAQRPMLVAGPASIRHRAAREAVYALCRDARIPLLAEATSQLRFGGPRRADVTVLDSFDLALRTGAGRRDLAPDLIVQLGAFPTSRGYADLVSGPSAPERVVISEHGWPDPTGTAAAVCRGDVGAIVESIATAAGTPERDATFFARVRVTDEALTHAVESVLSGPFGEAAVARTVITRLPSDAILVVGNSLPVRELDLVCPGRLGDFPVISQRGVSGIDGLVSGAIGSAAKSGKPTLLYIGDVSFLHDIGGLAAARDLRVPLVIVVSNNDGGRIFEQLPVARMGLDAKAMARFTTPHGLSFEPAAALYGLQHIAADSAMALSAAITKGLAARGCTIVEAMVPPGAAKAELDALFRLADQRIEEATS